MQTPDPKSFYNNVMPAKQGSDYEHARWHASALLEAQYEATKKTIERLAAPKLVGAQKIIEVGPGAGTWTQLLLAAAPTASYTLLDISSEMLARSRTALAGYPASISYVEHDFITYESNEAYDFFFSSRAIEYMANTTGIAKGVSRLLKKGGEGVIITKMPKSFMNALAGRTPSSFHTSQISPRDLRAAFAKEGLEVTGVAIATATVPGLKSPALNRLAYAFFSKVPVLLSIFAESYAVSFKKV